MKNFFSYWPLFIPRGRGNGFSLRTYLCLWGRHSLGGGGGGILLSIPCHFEKPWHHMFQQLGETKGSLNSRSLPSYPNCFRQWLPFYLLGSPAVLSPGHCMKFIPTQHGDQMHTRFVGKDNLILHLGQNLLMSTHGQSSRGPFQCAFI